MLIYDSLENCLYEGEADKINEYVNKISYELLRSDDDRFLDEVLSEIFDPAHTET